MDGAHDIPDSTDWLNTPLKAFADLENALHCQICKEFYDTPMITSCAHTFCSKCIRTSLSADGKCPACRASDQASKLRNNWALQEVVATFSAARPAAIVVARKEQEAKERAKRPGKRKRVILDSDDVAAERSERTTRSKSRRMAASQGSQTDAMEVEDTDGDEDFEPEQDDGLVECPLGCGKRMKIEAVEPHLDRCEAEKEEARRPKSRKLMNGYRSSRPPSEQSARPQERLAELNYSLLRDNAMRRKLEDIGIPASGSKQLLVRRHTEWVNLWNANCDSNSPRTKRELLLDLDTWERTQGGKAPNSMGLANGVMKKDFDGSAWASKNRDDFSRLIADAKRKKANPAMAPSPPKDVATSNDDTNPMENGDSGGSPYFPPSSQQKAVPITDDTPTQPYEDAPDALASVREKVEAANEGRHIEPVMNADFESSAPPRATTETTGPTNSHEPSTLDLRRPSDPVPGTANPALLAQSHFGNSTDEHVAQKRTELACDLPAHLQDPPGLLRKVPMFAMPQEPISDIDGGGVEPTL